MIRCFNCFAAVSLSLFVKHANDPVMEAKGSDKPDKHFQSADQSRVFSFSTTSQSSPNTKMEKLDNSYLKNGTFRVF